MKLILFASKAVLMFLVGLFRMAKCEMEQVFIECHVVFMVV